MGVPATAELLNLSLTQSLVFVCLFAACGVVVVVYNVSQVYVNGLWVGSHEGGYDSFSCSIADALEVWVCTNARLPFRKKAHTGRAKRALWPFETMLGLVGSISKWSKVP